MDLADIKLLYRYNDWANERILRSTARLTLEQLNLPGQLDHGSALDTLAHILDTEWSWRTAIQEGSLPGSYIRAADYPTLTALRKRWKEERLLTNAFLADLSDDRLNGTFEYRWARARPRRRVLWHILVHVVNHGTQHRSEVARYLTTCGHSPGEMDLANFSPKEIV